MTTLTQKREILAAFEYLSNGEPMTADMANQSMTKIVAHVCVDYHNNSQKLIVLAMVLSCMLDESEP